jgi:hypothetical protein
MWTLCEMTREARRRISHGPRRRRARPEVLAVCRIRPLKSARNAAQQSLARLDRMRRGGVGATREALSPLSTWCPAGPTGWRGANAGGNGCQPTETGSWRPRRDSCRTVFREDACRPSLGRLSLTGVPIPIPNASGVGFWARLAALLDRPASTIDAVCCTRTTRCENPWRAPRGHNSHRGFYDAAREPPRANHDRDPRRGGRRHGRRDVPPHLRLDQRRTVIRNFTLRCNATSVCPGSRCFSSG